MALLALGLVLPLVAPSLSSASRLTLWREASAGGLQPNYPRHDQVPRHPTAALSSRAAVRPTADGASVLLLVVVALNSAVMVVRVASSPPSWMKD